MSDAGAPEDTVVVGGRGRHGFAVSMRHVRRIVRADGLPEHHRRASLPRLFDDDPGTPEEARFAELVEGPEHTFLEVGPDVRVRPVAPSEIEPVPGMLRRTAARWGWQALVRAEGRFYVLVDVATLAALAAPRVRAAATAAAHAAAQAAAPEAHP